MSLWPSPQYSEHRIGNSPALAATNSMMIGASPGLARGTAFFTLNCFDFNAVRAVRRSHDETHTIAFSDLDHGRLENESACDDLKDLWLAVGRRRLLPRLAGYRHDRDNQ